jgi:hypothetical protein
VPREARDYFPVLPRFLIFWAEIFLSPGKIFLLVTPLDEPPVRPPPRNPRFLTFLSDYFMTRRG